MDTFNTAVSYSSQFTDKPHYGGYFGQDAFDFPEWVPSCKARYDSAMNASARTLDTHARLSLRKQDSVADLNGSELQLPRSAAVSHNPALAMDASVHEAVAQL